jgi:hypothetical protein
MLATHRHAAHHLDDTYSQLGATLYKLDVPQVASLPLRLATTTIDIGLHTVGAVGVEVLLIVSSSRSPVSVPRSFEGLSLFRACLHAMHVRRRFMSPGCRMVTSSESQ